MPTINHFREIERLVRLKQWTEIKPHAVQLQPADVAELFQRLEAPARVLLYRSLPRGLAADTFSFLPDEEQAALLHLINEQETRNLLADLSPDDRTELFEEVPAVVTQRLLNLLPGDERKEALMLLGYPEGSVARLMSPDFAAIRPGMTVGEALDAIRRQASDSETINIIYVTNEQGLLVDEIRLRRLFLAEPVRPVADLLDGNFRALKAFAPEEEAVILMKKTGLFALPVTDDDGVLLGVVTADDVLDLAVEGATEDIHKGSAITPLEVSYMKAPLQLLYSRRISWLMILVFVNLLSGAGIAYFEELITSAVALVFFLPLLIGSGGNVGAQASTLVIRGMALGEVALGDYLRVMWRELRVGLGLGISMALAVFLLAWWRSGGEIALVVATAMVSVVLLGSLVGMSLPFILRKIGQDPATASAPLVTSIADICGVLIYFGIASALLGAFAGG